MKKILIASSLFSLVAGAAVAAPGSANGVPHKVIKTMETASGDCLVAQDDAMELQNMSCDDYLASVKAAGKGGNGNGNGAPASARSIGTSTVLAPDS